MLNQVRANFTVAKVMGRYTGCQMRMLLGHRCFAQPSGRDMYGGDEISVARARERLSRLYFVGLVSEFRLSVCLMNYRLTGYRFVTQFQTKNCRPTMLDARSPRLNITDPGAFNWLPRDALDHVIFDSAAERFWADARQAGVNEAACPVLATPNFGCRSLWSLMPRIKADLRRVLQCVANGTVGGPRCALANQTSPAPGRIIRVG